MPVVVPNTGSYDTYYCEDSPSVTQVPSSGNAPRDLDSDGIYGDINGNSVIDFNDVVIFFTQMD